MKVLVTGAAGFIGSNLCMELGIRGHTVLGLDNLSSLTYPSAFKEKNISYLKLKLENNFRFIHGDVRNLSNIEKIVDEVDIIFNLAGVAGQSESWTKISEYTENNIVAVNRLLSFSAPRGKTIIHASTSSVYGNSSRASEDSQISPVSPYGITKYASEQLIDTYAQNFDFDFKILRFFSVYGPRQRPDMGIYKFIRKALNSENIELYGNGLALRTFTYVDDCVSAIISAGENKTENKIFNICGSQIVTILELITSIEEIISKKIEVRQHHNRLGDQLISIGDNTRIKKELNFSERFNLQAGLSEQIKWMKTIE